MEKKWALYEQISISNLEVWVIIHFFNTYEQAWDYTKDYDNKHRYFYILEVTAEYSHGN